MFSTMEREPFPSTIFFVGMEEGVLKSLNTSGT
jgi:hypothetical protein